MNAHVDSPRVTAWIERARDVPLLDAALKVGAKLKRAGLEWIGPCPNCHGVDRFSINPKLGVWNCRGAEGGKGPIDLVIHAKGCSFVEAVEFLTGESKPAGAREETAEEKAAREAKQAQWRAEREANEAAQARDAERKHARDEEAVDAILARAVQIQGTHAEAYLRARGLTPSRRLTGDLRFCADLGFWGFADQADADADRKRLLATVPAMIGAIRDVGGSIIGLHRTFLDPIEPRKLKPIGVENGKAKKFLGRAAGGMVRLGMLGETLAIAEGIEKAFGYHALRYEIEDLTIASALSLGNLAGSCTGSVDHPTARDAAGKPVKIRNGIPDMDRPGVILPPDVKSVIIIVDSTSDPIATRAAALTAARRFRAEGRLVSLQASPAGMDFDDLALAQRRELEAAA